MRHTIWTINVFCYNVHRFFPLLPGVAMKIVVHSLATFLLLTSFVTVSLTGQDSNGLQARQLYYKPQSAPEAPPKAVEQKLAEQKPAKSTAPTKAQHRLKTTASEAKTTAAEKSKPAEPNPLGLKYTIEQDDGSGKYVAVDSDKTFSTNDAIRLRMEVNTDAYVYLLSRGASGEGYFLFPQPGEDNHLKAFQSVQIPGAATDPLRFAEPSGTEILYIFVSRTPVADFDRLLPARGAPSRQRQSSGMLMAANVPSAQFGEMVDRAEHLQSRDLVRGKVRPVSDTGSGAITEHAVYAVNVSSAPGAQVLQKLELKHQ